MVPNTQHFRAFFLKKMKKIFFEQVQLYPALFPTEPYPQPLLVQVNLGAMEAHPEAIETLLEENEAYIHTIGQHILDMSRLTLSHGGSRGLTQ
jgi:hypothetical protein